jgi:ribosome maturation factor RimP
MEFGTYRPISYICIGIKNHERERKRSLLLCPELSFYMDFTTQQQKIEQFVQDFIADSPDVFLVEVKVTPGNNIKVFVDADNGITIDKCTRINRVLYKYLEEQELFTNNDFALEVSSPGLEEPLKLLRQYQKNLGRRVEVTMNDGTKHEGKLLAADEKEVAIEQTEGKGKKAISKTRIISFDQIKHTIVLVTF